MLGERTVAGTILGVESPRGHARKTAMPPEVDDALLATEVDFVSVILGGSPQQLARILRAA